jgi:hypothetical protein
MSLPAQPDKFGVASNVAWYVAGASLAYPNATWELVIDPATEQIVHFLLQKN